MHPFARQTYRQTFPGRGSCTLILLMIFCIAAATALALPRNQQDTELEKSSERLFLEAETYFTAKNYWAAARDLVIVLDFNPDFARTDRVVFMLGECLYEIGLPLGATRLYQHLITRHLRSPLLPEAMLGLQRIEYDRQDYTRCIDHHQAIFRSRPSSPVANAANYFAGLAYYHLRDFPKTIELLSRISLTSSYYPHGQYTLALAQMRMRQVPRAIMTLRTICTMAVENDEMRALIDETHLTLGYLYYELQYYDRAHKEFLQVSAIHENQDAALLAMGWSLLQQGELTAAIAPLTELVQRFPTRKYAEEGLFLLGRCYMSLKQYDDAIRIYDHLIRLFPSSETMPAIKEEAQGVLLDESIAVEHIKTDLLVMESNLLDALPLQGDEHFLPHYYGNERNRIIESRQGILRRIQEERMKIDAAFEEIQYLRELLVRKQSRQDWRAYAEYSKSRALFMQSMQP